MAEKKQQSGKQKPVHQVRRGEVLISVHSRQSNAGFHYYDFTLGRYWSSMATGKEAHGTSFFEKHHEDLVLAIQEACDWIRAKPRSATTDSGLDTSQPASRTPLKEAMKS